MSVKVSDHRYHWGLRCDFGIHIPDSLAVCRGFSRRRRELLAAALGVDAEEGGSSEPPPNCGLPESVLLLPPPAAGRPTEVTRCFAILHAILHIRGMLNCCMQLVTWSHGQLAASRLSAAQMQGDHCRCLLDCAAALCCAQRCSRQRLLQGSRQTRPTRPQIWGLAEMLTWRMRRRLCFLGRLSPAGLKTTSS